MDIEKEKRLFTRCWLDHKVCVCSVVLGTAQFTDRFKLVEEVV